MKDKEIFLDFTPLLDVTLIILFFFILFSNVEVAESKLELDNKTAQVEQTRVKLDHAISQYEATNLETQEKLNQLSEGLEILSDSDARQAANIRGMIEFTKDANIKLILKADEDIRELQIFHAGELISTVGIDSVLGSKLAEAMKSAGYTTKDTIFCEFILDGSQPGTHSARKQITQEIENIKSQYRYFYLSETDISKGKD